MGRNGWGVRRSFVWSGELAEGPPLGTVAQLGRGGKRVRYVCLHSWYACGAWVGCFSSS